MDAFLSVVSSLALLDDQPLAADTTVTLVEHGEIICHAVGDRYAGPGKRTGPVGEQRNEYPARRRCGGDCDRCGGYDRKAERKMLQTHDICSCWRRLVTGAAVLPRSRQREEEISATSPQRKRSTTATLLPACGSRCSAELRNDGCDDEKTAHQQHGVERIEVRNQRRDQQHANPAAQMADAVDQREAGCSSASRKVLGRPAIGNRNPQIKAEEKDDRADNAEADLVTRKRHDHAADNGQCCRHRQPRLALHALAVREGDDGAENEAERADRCNQPRFRRRIMQRRQDRREAGADGIKRDVSDKPHGEEQETRPR